MKLWGEADYKPAFRDVGTWTLVLPEQLWQVGPPIVGLWRAKDLLSVSSLEASTNRAPLLNVARLQRTPRVLSISLVALNF